MNIKTVLCLNKEFTTSLRIIFKVINFLKHSKKKNVNTKQVNHVCLVILVINSSELARQEGAAFLNTHAPHQFQFTSYNPLK